MRVIVHLRLFAQVYLCKLLAAKGHVADSLRRRSHLQGSLFSREYINAKIAVATQQEVGGEGCCFPARL
jgi:hypothetical protein